MSTLVIHLESKGKKWSELDDITKLQLINWFDHLPATSDQRAQHQALVESNLKFSPLTGEIRSLGIYDIERALSTVYLTSDEAVPVVVEDGVRKVRHEADVLCDFWQGVSQYQTVVTFSGRSFALPFLVHRSLAYGIRPSVDLLRFRYLTQQVAPYHVDLQDQLTFYGAWRKRPSLHLLCQAYGIESPIQDEETTAEDFVVHTGRYVKTTTDLYHYWRAYLAPAQFRPGDEGLDF